MSQRARAYRRQARTDRYGAAAFAHQTSRPNRVGQFQEVQPGPGWDSCPHCGATGLDLMETHSELVQVARLHGVQVLDVPLPQGSEIGGWWFCHHCDEGGAFLKLPA